MVSASIAAVITAVAFDLDGTLLDHGRAAGDAVRGWVAARGWQAPEDASAHWLRLEREHFAAFATGAISFEEQRRRRLRAFLPLVSSAGVGEEDLDDLFAEYATFYESRWVAFDDAGERQGPRRVTTTHLTATDALGANVSGAGAPRAGR